MQRDIILELPGVNANSPYSPYLLNFKDSRGQVRYVLCTVKRDAWGESWVDMPDLIRVLKRDYPSLLQEWLNVL